MEQKETLSELLSEVLKLDTKDAAKAVGENGFIPDIDEKIARLEELKTPWSPEERFVKCKTVDELITIIKGVKQGQILRIAGSQHSIPEAVFSKNTVQAINVKLDGDFRKFDELFEQDGSTFVRVGAGCNLGIDPSDKDSNAENSFNRCITKKGFALPVLGGLSHQTIAGFMLTGSAGGSLKHSFGDAIHSIEFIDGTGKPQKFTNGDEEFFAAGVSMGLFGVITFVTLKLVPNYRVAGVEATVHFAESVVRSGSIFQQALKDEEFMHCVWFPQKNVENVMQFRGRAVEPTTPIMPYKHLLHKRITNYLAAGVLYIINELQFNATALRKIIASLLLNMINPPNASDFCDEWYIALPSDDQAMVDTVMRTQFTEVWIDVEHVNDVLKALSKLFADDELAGGNFGIELYGAKKSSFWLSPAYGRDVVRVDPFWWEHNPHGKPEEFFTKYWKVLLTIPTARLHWGKHMPKVGTSFGDITIGPDYVKKSFNDHNNFDKWMVLRERFDPQQIFVTDYWRAHFGIQ
ncbi:MAG TPA: D-arabinono-1,4-lactone oxidase [Chitinophagaceae bacterium]|nr:D-arabinono-1,4-lactone oxidase [Chitinophagaceae bacterium]